MPKAERDTAVGLGREAAREIQQSGEGVLHVMLPDVLPQPHTHSVQEEGLQPKRTVSQATVTRKMHPGTL